MNPKLLKEDKIWSKAVKERDHYRCIICFSAIRPNAHHVIPIEIQETRHDINNGVTLCPGHHKFFRILSAHNNPLAFFIWLEKNRKEQYDYCRDKAGCLARTSPQ